MHRVGVLLLLFCTILTACDGATSPEAPAAQPPAIAPAPAAPPPEPPPPPLDPAARAVLLAALSGAPTTGSLSYARTSVGMLGEVSSSFELTRQDDAFVGRLSCNVLGAPRELDVRVDAALVRTQLERLASVQLASAPERPLGGILEGSESRSLTIGSGEMALRLSSSSFAGAGDPWSLASQQASAFTSSPAVEEIVHELIRLATADRCDTQPASAFPRAGGIVGHL